MWSLNSPRERRTSGPENFQSSAEKTFSTQSGAKRTSRLGASRSEFDPGCVKTHKFEMRRVFTQPRPKADVSRTFSGCYGLRCLRDFQQVHMRRIHLDCCCAATWPLAVEAQQTNSQRRIAILMILAKDDPEQTRASRPSNRG